MKRTYPLLATLLLLAAGATAANAVERASAAKRYCAEYEPPKGGWPLNVQFALPLRLYSSCARIGGHRWRRG